jgi:hypothetical protein
MLAASISHFAPIEDIAEARGPDSGAPSRLPPARSPPRHGRRGPTRRQTRRRLHSDMSKDSPDDHRRDRPACAREDAYAEPDADLVEVDGGGHWILPVAT